jgi:phosphoribosylformylglycinamidine synthase II
MTLSSQDIREIESLLGREPTAVETCIFDTMWSEHCSYKSSKRLLSQFPTKGRDVALGIGEDAGIIRLTTHDGRTYCIAISHESHNHPSQILPVEGAATGVGGCVRDVYCMGADVIGVLNSLHFGDPATTDQGLVSEISEKVVLGIGEYGNPLGVPVLGGETVYHDSYNDNCLVNVAALGLVEESKIIHSYTPDNARIEPYDVILFGKSTDATGFGGASFSSTILDQDDDAYNVGAVQVHDPFLKRVLVEATKSLLTLVHDRNIPIGFKDLGAGGISCATSEIAISSGFGVKINLDQVNVGVPGLPAEVIACSETQERYCLVVPRYFTPEVLTLFNQTFELPKLYPNAGAALIGEITTEQTYTITFGSEVVCHLPIKTITTDVTVHREMADHRKGKIKMKNVDNDQYSDQLSDDQLKSYCIQTLNLLNNRSKRYVYTHFDHSVRGDTIIYPGEADAVVVAPIQSSTVGVSVSMDSNLYGHIDPYVAGCYAVSESVRNVISVGGCPIALTDCLNYGNPEKPSVFYDFDQGIKGISDAANALSFIENEPIPVVSGNVSFYNESKSGNAVIPSPVIMCVGKVENYFHTITMQLKVPELRIALLGNRFSEFGGTQFSSMSSRASMSSHSSLTSHASVAPQVRLSEEHAQNQVVCSLILKRALTQVHDIAMGGLWQTVVEMVLGENGECHVGLDLDFSAFESLETVLFSENGGYLVAFTEDQQATVDAMVSQFKSSYYLIGKTTSDAVINVTHPRLTLPGSTLKMRLNELVASWKTGQR